MSKIKESLLRQEEKNLEVYINFYEWLDSFQSKYLSEAEINQLEEEEKLSEKCSSSNKFNKQIISARSSNNPKFNPKKGA